MWALCRDSMITPEAIDISGIVGARIALLFVGATVTTNLSAATDYTPDDVLTVSAQGNGLVVGVHSLIPGGRGTTEGCLPDRITWRSHVW